MKALLTIIALLLAIMVFGWIIVPILLAIAIAIAPFYFLMSLINRQRMPSQPGDIQATT
jgi:hypothetical protein